MCRWTLPIGALILALLTIAPPAQAQTPMEVMRENWERQMETVIEYVEAMPEEHLGYRPTPEVRTFAEQIEHIVTDHVDIVSTAFDLAHRPNLGNPEVYLQDRAALLEHVHTGFDWVFQVLDLSSEADLREEGEIFGRYRMPRWRALEGALEHGTWTLGQVVPYLRLHGVTPPANQIFPLTYLIGEG